MNTNTFINNKISFYKEFGDYIRNSFKESLENNTDINIIRKTGLLYEQIYKFYMDSFTININNFPIKNSPIISYEEEYFFLQKLESHYYIQVSLEKTPITFLKLQRMIYNNSNIYHSLLNTYGFIQTVPDSTSSIREHLYDCFKFIPYRLYINNSINLPKNIFKPITNNLRRYITILSYKGLDKKIDLLKYLKKQFFNLSIYSKENLQNSFKFSFEIKKNEHEYFYYLFSEEYNKIKTLLKNNNKSEKIRRYVFDI